MLPSLSQEGSTGKPNAAVAAACSAAGEKPFVAEGVIPAAASAGVRSYLSRSASVPFIKPSWVGNTSSAQVPCFSYSCAQNDWEGPLSDTQYLWRRERAGEGG